LNHSMHWKHLLAAPSVGDHMVQTYQDQGFLAEAIAHFVECGLQRREGILLIATQPHWQAIAERLKGGVVDAAGALAAGQLVVLEAEATLTNFMRGGMPEWTAFEKTVVPVLDELQRKFATVRAYGEMVDILWQAGNREASYRLEEYWNALIEKIPFSLLCAYFIDHLDPHLYGGPLERVCRCHSHMIPARDEAELERAVAVSTQKIMGAALSGMLGTLASTYRPRTLMPMPQATLFYLCENMPVTARKVLKKMRDERSLRNTSL